MGLFSWFKKKGDDDFDKILEELDNSIRTKEENLAFIKNREAKAVLYLLIYSTLFYVVYVVVWWFGLLDLGTGQGDNGDDADEPVSEGNELLERALKTIPVGLLPILIIFMRRIVKAWYNRSRQRENKELQALRKRQREQIDKLKKLSNYDKITEMLERHGQSAGPRSMNMPGGLGGLGTPAKGGAVGPGSAFSTPVGKGQRIGGPPDTLRNGINMTPAQIQAAQLQATTGKAGVTGSTTTGPRKVFPAPPGPLRGPVHPGTPANSNTVPIGVPATPADLQQLQVQQAGLNFQPNLDEGPPPPKGLLDKLAEALLGGDVENSPASKYALICLRCFAHNGLVMKEEMMDIQFICPKCGAFNPSRRARMTGASSNQPKTATESTFSDANDDPPEPTATDAASSLSLERPTGRTKSTSSPLSESFTPEDGSDEEEADDSIIRDSTKLKPDKRKTSLRKRQAKGSAVTSDMAVDDDE